MAGLAYGGDVRLRPSPQNPVVHHTLSFADGEDPGDEMIAAIAEKYIERMKLERHQWVAVVHRDKAHVHAHLAINRIGYDGEWWNATRDFERSQVVAGKIEVEFGLVRVPRQRLSLAISRALRTENITPPKVPPPPPTPVADPKHVLAEMRALVEGIPFGLPAPEWARELQVAGLVVKPSIGGEKISGFTLRMPGHRSVKLSDIHRSLSWPKLLSSGRVFYDPELHFESLSQLQFKGDPHEPPPTSSTPSLPLGDDERIPDPESGLWTWDWQPLQPLLVDVEMGTGSGADPDPASPDISSGPDDLRPEKPSQPGAFAPGGPGASPGETQPKKRRVQTASRVREHAVPDGQTSAADDIELLPLTPTESEQYLLGLDPKLRQEPGSDRDFGVHARPSDARTPRPAGTPEPVGELAQPVGGSLPRGSLPSPTGDRRAHPDGGDLGWLGVPGDARDLTGAQADFEDLRLPQAAIPPEVRRAATQAVTLESTQRLTDAALQRRVDVRETLWEETQLAGLSHDQYRTAKMGLQKVQQHLEVARSIVRDLTSAAKQGHGFPLPPREESSRVPVDQLRIRKRRP